MEQTLPQWLDILLSVLILFGAAFAFIGSFGLAKLSSFLMRLHGPTKATTLGVGCVLVSSAMFFSATQTGISVREVLVAGFLFLTAPLSAMMLARAAAKLDESSKPPELPDNSAKRS